MGFLRLPCLVCSDMAALPARRADTRLRLLRDLLHVEHVLASAFEGVEEAGARIDLEGFHGQQCSERLVTRGLQARLPAAGGSCGPYGCGPVRITPEVKARGDCQEEVVESGCLSPGHRLLLPV